MTTVNEALSLLFTTKEVEVIVNGLGLHLKLEDGYHSDMEHYEKALDKTEVTSITVHENGGTTIQATYTGFGAEGLRGDMIQLHTCESGLWLASEGASFYAWSDNRKIGEEGANYTFSVPMSEVSLIDDGEYRVGETMSTSQLKQLAEEVGYND